MKPDLSRKPCAVLAMHSSLARFHRNCERLARREGKIEGGWGKLKVAGTVFEGKAKVSKTIYPTAGGSMSQDPLGFEMTGMTTYIPMPKPTTDLEKTETCGKIVLSKPARLPSQTAVELNRFVARRGERFETNLATKPLVTKPKPTVTKRVCRLSTVTNRLYR